MQLCFFSEGHHAWKLLRQGQTDKGGTRPLIEHGGAASSRPLHDLLQWDGRHSLRLTRLTPSHLPLSAAAPMRTTTAADVLSYGMVSALEHSVKQQQRSRLQWRSTSPAIRVLRRCGYLMSLFSVKAPWPLLTTQE